MAGWLSDKAAALKRANPPVEEPVAEKPKKVATKKKAAKKKKVI